MKRSLATLFMLVLSLTACGQTASQDAGPTPTPTDYPTPSPLPPTAVPPTTPPAGSGAQGTAVFSRAFRAAMGEETQGINAVSGVDLSPGNGSSTLPRVQEADRHFKQAASLASNAGGSPYDDVGARFLDAFLDEEAMATQLLGDYPDGPVRSDYGRIMSDHQKLLQIQVEMKQHGY